jgi:hydrogenase expression/formation protein HypE
VVTPVFFPGGDIGQHAVNGTVNNLAVSGALPMALSLAFILEEGFPLQELERIVESAKRAAQRAGIQVVTGDTKVVGRGHADKIFVNTSGIGLVPEGIDLGTRRVAAGDAILLSGPIGEHGIAILSRREGLELGGEVLSDTAPLHEVARMLLGKCPAVHAMRDPTRGGVASTLVDVAKRRHVGIDVDESLIPVRDVVRRACERLGLDPMFVANEGKLVAFVPEDQVESALTEMRAHPLGREAVRIGTVTAEHPGVVWMRSAIGATRAMELPFGEALPRIC